MEPKTEGLYLYINRVVERKCHAILCYGGIEHEVDYAVSEDGVPVAKRECRCCHGAGRVKRRVRGLVPVNYGIHNGTVRWNYQGLTTFGTLEGLCADVVLAYPDEIPPGIAAGLKEEDA